MTMRARIARIVQRDDTRAGRAFDIAALALILCAMVAFSIETLPGLPAGARRALRIAEVVLTLLFTVEYALRLATAPSRPRYFFSFYGLVDLLAIAPFYLTLGGVDLLLVRLVRLFRIFRVLKIFRYSEAMARFARALALAREEILLFLLAAGILIFLSAAGIYHFEHEAQPQHFGSVFDSLWWAVVTLTTVGYGDAYPVTVGGKLFTVVVLACGLGIVAVPSGLVAAALSKAREEDRHAEGDDGAGG